jgi:hypothetical protein
VPYDFTQWWKDWWEEDYSWEGLAKKPWAGWCVTANGELIEDPASWLKDNPGHGERPKGAVPATLQDYWRDQEGFLIECPTTGKKFTQAHLPLLWENNEPAPKIVQTELLKSKFAASSVNELSFFGQLTGPCRTVQLNGVVLRKFDVREISVSLSETGHAEIHFISKDCFFAGGAYFENTNFIGKTTFDNAAFENDARFESSTFDDGVDFENALFSGNARFSQTTFKGHVNFSNCAFAKSARFDKALFKGNAVFDYASFANGADFGGTSFLRSAFFSFVAFRGSSNFDSASFFDGVHFSGAVFREYTSFGQARFFEDTWFDGASFLGTSFFDRASFSGDLSFTDTVFCEYTSFKDTTFSSPSVFSSATFASTVSFTRAAFCGDVSFVKAVFGATANLSGEGVVMEIPKQTQNLAFKAASSPAFDLEGSFTTPKQLSPLAQRSFGKIDASGAIFLDEVIFDNRDIHEPSSFRDCLFMKRASFHGSKLHQGVTFHGAEFEACLDPTLQCTEVVDNNWLKRANLRLRNAYYGFLDFVFAVEMPALRSTLFDVPNRALTRLHEVEAKRLETLGEPAITYEEWLANFEAKRHKAANDFCALPQKTKDGETGDSKDRYFADLEDAFRTLKRAMEDNRNRPEEGRFFKLELQARRRRRRPAVPWWERGMSDLYLWSSDFGMSVVRPVVWLKVTVVLFACLYAGLVTLPIRTPTGVELAEVTSFSLGRVLPFGPWADEPDACSPAGRLFDVAPTAAEIATNADCKSDLANHYGPFTALGVRLLASLQSFIALVLVFLAALAARRRFQIN